MKGSIIVAFLLILTFNNQIYAQKVEIIEVDTLTNRPSKELPFDMPFILKIKGIEKPNEVVIVQHKRNKSLSKSIGSKCYNVDKNFIDIPKSFYWVEKDYLFIKFDYFPNFFNLTRHNNNILKPSKDYTLILIDSEEGFIIHKDLNNFNKSNNTDSICYKRALKKYKGLYKEQEIILGKKSTFLTPYELVYKDTTIFVFDSLFYKPSIDSLIYEQFEKLDSLEKIIISYRPKKSEYSLNKNDLKHICKYLRQIDSSENKVLAIDLDGTFQFCKNLFYMQDTCLQMVLKGKIVLGQESCITVENLDYLKTIKNYQVSITGLNKLINTIEKLQYCGLSINDIINKSLLPLRNELIKNKEIIEETISEKRNVSEYIKMHDNNRYTINSITTSTHIFDFEKRSKFQITPDFGWVYYGFQEDFNGFTPYLGFHINFRYINKDIPFSKLPNRKLLHRLSFMTAWSLTSIAEEDKRKDFFSCGTLLTGFGFRLNNSLRITGGVNWFYKLNPNPTITSKELAVTPYLGLSIDLDVKKFLNDFTSLRLQK